MTKWPFSALDAYLFVQAASTLMEFTTKLATVLSLSVTEAPSPGVLMMFPREDFADAAVADALGLAASACTDVAGATVGAVGDVEAAPPQPASMIGRSATAPSVLTFNFPPVENASEFAQQK